MKHSSFFALLSRMKYIRRWGLMRSAREENLAEHSLDVALLAHALAVIGNCRLGRQYDMKRVLLYAMYHDAPEILTGDLPTPVKYHDERIRQSYKQLEREAGRHLLQTLPEDLRGDYEEAFREPSGDICRLIKAADKLAALQKCVEEELAGNREFVNARDASRRALEALALPEADIFLQEFFPACGQTLDGQFAALSQEPTP